ncbi:hypothetical protein JCM4814A_92130 [Streptomyces phaeofaciens JCM 4814]|uniref:Uncharacterized protein n=1 Tax=Streptomyces phaeofaciens TaxID=68254 RepID=A0A918HL48_9ACTN|nr:hypothetical protein [Streptomyces phaeofaciens]GGT70523.1 hypothetical protein GCM10010226_55480 [Streptomyces phaeofaciens]
MLSLTPPFLSVNGFSLFPDHADPLQWYYLPMGPSIAVRSEGGSPVPVFSLLQFRGTTKDVTGGLLNFDVVLGPHAEVLDQMLDDVAGQIQSQLNLPDRPRRPVPVPIEDGSVKLVLLDSQTDDEPGAQGFVERIIHYAKPSLYGVNQAAFSARLDADGAKLMDACLDGAAVPIGVVYSLQFLALRPAYTVTLNVRWKQLKERLDKAFGVDGVFLSSQVTEELDRLRDERIIDVQDDFFVPEGEAGKSVIADHSRAVSAVYDMITDALFEVSLPPRPAPDGWDKAAGLATEFGRVAVTGGLSLLGSYTYRRDRSVQDVEKTLNVQMSQRTAVRRTVHPQGHLSGIADLITASGRPRSDFVRGVSLDDPWFKQRQVAVVSRVQFPSNYIASVAVDLRYGGETSTVLLDEAHNEGTAQWFSQVEDGHMVTPVQMDVTYHLKNTENYTLPNEISASSVVDGEKAEIRPDDVFRLTKVLIRAEDLTWAHWNGVTVELRYEDKTLGASGQYVIDMTDQAPAWNWYLFLSDSAPEVFSYRLTYRGRDRQDVVREWAEHEGTDLRIDDPFPDVHRVTVRPLADWSAVSALLVDLLYEDPAHQVRQEASMEFGADNAGSQLFEVPLRDPTLLRVSYRVTTLFTDGHQSTVPESSTGQSRLIVSPDMPVTQAVVVRVDTSAGAADGVREVLVEFAAPGTDTVTANYPFTLHAGAVVHEYTMTGTPGYRYRVTYHHDNGMSREGSWTDTNLPVLDVPGA